MMIGSLTFVGVRGDQTRLGTCAIYGFRLEVIGPRRWWRCDFVSPKTESIN